VRIHFRRFLLTFLMLALPLQAFASASMLGCALSHQAVVLESAMADDPMAMAGCHESQHPDAPPTQHDCKHCAACYLASALPIPAFAAPAVMPVSTAFIAHSAASFSGFIPDGPERPPRTASV
jgi:hypothetical protein